GGETGGTVQSPEESLPREVAASGVLVQTSSTSSTPAAVPALRSGTSATLAPANQGEEQRILDHLAEKIASTKFQFVPGTDTAFEMLPRCNSLDDVWDEWFFGDLITPSIWGMDKHQPKWRRGWDTSKRGLYSFKKKLVYAVLNEPAFSSEDEALDTRVTRALAAMQGAADQAGSLNQLNLSLQVKKAKRASSATKK
ncbi:hypothetical protein BGZ98_005916, partial [Dissophora globulifera]